MDKHHHHIMQSASCMCSFSSFENNEHEFVRRVAHRCFVDAADTITVLRPKRSWPSLTANLTGHCSASDSANPISPGIPTADAATVLRLEEVHKSELVSKTDAEATILINDATSIQDIRERTSSEDALPVNYILLETNPAKDSTLQETFLETGVVDNISSERTPTNFVSCDEHRLESDSVRYVKETNSQVVSCAAEATSLQCPLFSYSVRLLLYQDAKVSYCCDDVKPRLSPSYDAITDCDNMDQCCKKIHKSRRKDRPQRAMRKWKKVPKEMQLNLRINLFPRNGIMIDNSTIDDIEENEIQQEYELFQNTLQSCERRTDVDAEIDKTCTAAISNIQELFADCKEKETIATQHICKQQDTDISKDCVNFKASTCINEPVQNNSSGHEAHKILPKFNSERPMFRYKTDLDVRFSDCENLESVSFYENKIPLRYGSDLESLFELTKGKLRAKKKWKETKAHIQVKTKYCCSLGNSVHGQTFYIHHRVLKLSTMELKPRAYSASLSLKQIDKARGLESGSIKALLVISSVKAGGHTKQSPANRSAANLSRFAVDAFNADGDLSADVVNIMINLQHRDLLPEDYDLLLRLDDRVKPKTVDIAILTTLKTESVVCECDVLDVCAVCLDPYEVGQTKKYLPCQHYFHEACIDSWLSNSSMNCPLDGTPVLSS